MFFIFSIRSCYFSVLKRNPLYPFVIISGIPPTSEDSTILPFIIPSSITIPNPSHKDGTQIILLISINGSIFFPIFFSQTCLSILFEEINYCISFLSLPSPTICNLILILSTKISLTVSKKNK